MKRGFLTTLLAFVSFAASRAGDYDYLVVEDNQSNVTAFVSEGLKLTFGQASGQTSYTLTVAPASGDATTIPTADIKKMYFSDKGKSTGIEAVDSLIADTEVDAFGVDGQSVGRFSSISEAVKSLPKGIYIMRTETKNIKVVVR